MIVKTQQRQLATVQSADGGDNSKQQGKEALVVDFPPSRRQEGAPLAGAMPTSGRGSVHPTSNHNASTQEGRKDQSSTNGTFQGDGPINKLRKRFGAAVGHKVRSPQRKMPSHSAASTSSPSVLMSTSTRPQPLSLREASSGTVRTDAAVYQGKPGSATSSPGPNATNVAEAPLRQRAHTADRSPLKYIDNVYVVRQSQSPPPPRSTAAAVTPKRTEQDGGVNANWTAFVDERQRRQQEQLGQLPSTINRAQDPSTVSVNEGTPNTMQGTPVEDKAALRQQQIRRHTYSMTAAGATPERGGEGLPVLLPTRKATTPTSRRPKRHVRRNTDDTDMTPTTNNLTAALCPTPPKHWRNARTHPLLANGKCRPKGRNAGPIDVDAVSITTSSSGASSNSGASEAVNEEDNTFLGRVYDMYVLNDSSDNEKEKDTEVNEDDAAMGNKNNAPSPASFPSPLSKTVKEMAGTPPLSPARGAGVSESIRQGHDEKSQSHRLASIPIPSSPRTPPPILLNPVPGGNTPTHSPPHTPNRRRCNTTGSALTKEAIAQHESRYKDDGAKKRAPMVKNHQKKILGRSASFRMRSLGQPPQDQSPQGNERNYRRQNSDRRGSYNDEGNIVLDRWKREHLVVERWEKHKAQQQEMSLQGKKVGSPVMNTNAPPERAINPPLEGVGTRQERYWTLGRLTGSSPPMRRPVQQESRPADRPATEGRGGIGRWGGSVRNPFFFSRQNGSNNLGKLQQQQPKAPSPPLVGGRRLKGTVGGSDASPRTNTMLVEADTGLEVIPFMKKGFVHAH